MSATPYSLRYLANRIINDDVIPDESVPFQSNLEKAGRAMRYALKTVQYYSPNYNYIDVVKERNENAKSKFD
jgi:hypothetical protein